MANDVHVIKKCEALGKVNADKEIFTFASHSIKSSKSFKSLINSVYAINSCNLNINFKTYHLKSLPFYNGVVGFIALIYFLN